MSDANDLEALWGKLSEVLDGIDDIIGGLGSRIDDAAAALDRLQTLSAQLKLAAILVEETEPPTPETYSDFADRLFAELGAKLAAAREVAETRFDPEAALSDVEEEVASALDEVDALAAEEAAALVESAGTLTASLTGQISDRISGALADWEELSSEVETKVSDAIATFDAAREAAAGNLDDILAERIAEELSEHLGGVAENIDSLFDAAEDMMDQAEKLVSEKTERLVDMAKAVLDVQEAIAKLRPVLELIL